MFKTSGEGFEKLVSEYEFEWVCDIGSGPEALHSQGFHGLGKMVQAIDHQMPAKDFPFPYVVNDYNRLENEPQYDCVWCSHVLEHQTNPGQFLQAIFTDLEDEGILALTVPPMREKARTHELVGGHLTRWDAGLLCYNLVLAGFDCSQAIWKQYKYNITLIVEKKTIEYPQLHYDAGDIERLAKFMPEPFRTERCDGGITEWRWT
jgi:hypothetical protein